MVDEREQATGRAGATAASSVARLLEAEQKGDEIVARARQQADELVSDAKRRAQQIREVRNSEPGVDGGPSSSKEELDKQKNFIAEQGEKRITAMRLQAQARLNEAAEKILAYLLGHS